LENLQQLLDLVHARLDFLVAAISPVRLGARVDEGQLLKAVESVLAASAAFRKALDDHAARLGLEASAVGDYDDFLARVDALRSADVLRLEGVAKELSGAEIRARLTRRRDRLLELRDAAVRELGSGAPAPALGGPIDGAEWLTWWWNLPTTDAEDLLNRVIVRAPAFAELLGETDADELVLSPRAPGDAPRNEMRPPLLMGPQVIDESLTSSSATSDAPSVPPVDVSHSGTGQIRNPDFDTEIQSDDPPDTAAAEPAADSLTSPSPNPPDSEARGVIEEDPRLKRDNRLATALSIEQTPPPRPAAREWVAPHPPEPVPDHLRTFPAFAEQHWISPHGDLERPPWLASKFSQELDTDLQEALKQRDLARAWVFATVLADRQDATSVHPDDLHDAAELLAQPRSPLAGHRERAARLSSGGPPDASLGLQLTLTLEALRPSDEPVFGTVGLVERAVASAEFHDESLRRVITSLLMLSMTGRRPVDSLLDAHRAEAQPTPTDLAAILKQAHVDLAEVFRSRYNAAGGKIQRTHCRDAWAEFIKGLHERIRPLFPGDRSAPWTAASMERVIRDIPKLHARAAEKWGARYEDRRKMDHAAGEIADAAAAVVAARRRLDEAQRQTLGGHVIDPVPARDLHDLVEGSLSDPQEEICRCLIEAVVKGQRPAKPVLGVSASALLQRPVLITCLEAGEVAALPRVVEATTELFSADALRDVRRAAAIMLAPPLPPFSVSKQLDLVHMMTEGLGRARRPELIGYFLPLLPEGERDRARRDWDDLVQGVQDQVSRIEDLWRRLDDLGHNEGQWLQTIGAEVKGQLESRPASPPPDLQLISHWLRRIEEAGESLQRYALDHLLYRVAGRPEEEQVAAAIREGRFAEALLGVDPTGSVHHPDERATPWRQVAEERFVNPLSRLRSLSAQGGAGAELIDAWIKVTADANKTARRIVARHFARYVFGENYKVDGHLETDDGGVSVPVGFARRQLAIRRLNPTFIPQLSSWKAIVLLVAPIAVNSAQFASQAAVLASAHENALVYILAPNVTEQMRKATISRLQDRGVRAAIVDDIDLLRIVSPDDKGATADPFLAIMEVGLEQQPLKAVDPFAGHEGQHVKMEMYVGRREEANQLAKTPRFSRLFSGRKLGKSALLRYMEEAIDKELPSGNTLNVLYIPVVGIDSEEGFVRRVLEHLRSRFQLTLNEEAAEPGERLLSALATFLEKEPSHSLLFVLDEADVFVEAQVEEYETRRERCLTFRIRTEVEAIRDSTGFPRARFVFSGYRATHTNDGAWANWGEVLVLSPLDALDAQKLVAGPLARLGIDAHAQAASIAYRCGYQPAVLLRFGQVLMRELEQRRARLGTRRLEVDAALVARVFNDSAVQEEIVTVVQNNFQGNDAAFVIFNMMLVEFGALPPGSDISDLADRIVERLVKVTEGSLQQTGDRASEHGQVEMVLRDLRTRRLLVEERVGSASTYRLNFPHHLPILHRRNPEQQARLRLASLGRQPLHAAERVRALLPKQDLENVRDCISGRYADLGVAAVVVSSLWPEALAHDHGGIAVRLGLRVARPDMKNEGAGPRSAILAEPEIAERVMENWRPKQPATLLIGGPALLRWALGRPRDGERSVETVGTGRLSRFTLDWWFTRVWGLEFPESRNLPLIAEKTGGVPPLVGLVQEALAGRSGETLNSDELERAFTAFDERFDSKAREIRMALQPRELEVLDLVCRASRYAQPGLSIEDELSDLGAVEDVPFEHIGPGDEQSIDLLIQLGLLPATSGSGLPRSRLLCVEEDDPIRRVLAAPTV
jgi:hypothetical protein